MKIIIHDLNEQDFSSLGVTGNDIEVINANDKFAPCTGCSGCWFKTPGTCKTNDGLKNFGALSGNSEEMVIISKNCYGGYSEAVKRVLDRSVPACLPFFTYRSGKIKHRPRYNVKRKCLTVFLYGDFLEIEKDAAERMVAANRITKSFKEANLHIINDFSEIGAFLHEHTDY
jgi:multimeric flavodoxin WrbA